MHMKRSSQEHLWASLGIAEKKGTTSSSLFGDGDEDTAAARVGNGAALGKQSAPAGLPSKPSIISRPVSGFAGDE